jgi:hypothetical protein
MPFHSWGRGYTLWRLIVFSLLSLLFPSTIAWCSDVGFDGSLEIRGTYDTNVLLTADDYDFELRRLAGNQTEEDDFYGSLLSDLKWSIPVNDFFEQKIRYRAEMERYADLDDENAENNRLEFLPTFYLSDNVDLILEYDFEYDNRRPGAEYLRPDYLQNEAGATLDWEPYYGGTLLFGYLYENRNYKSLTGTPFDDYSGHLGRLGWEHRFNKKTRANVELRYLIRDYADDTLDANGDPIPGQAREDEEGELRLALTHLLTSKTLLRAGYVYRDHFATGEFYDYDLHRVSGIWVQELPWRTRLQTYLHHDWRNYDRQAAQETTRSVSTGESIQDPTDDERADRQFLFLLNLTKELGKGFSCGTEFRYLDNQSNDDSSAYNSQSYSLFVRYRF